MASSTIYFATNRNPIELDGRIIDFNKNFSENGLADLRFGQAQVDSDNGKVTDLQVAPNAPEEGSAAVYSQIKQKMAVQGRSTLIIIHGYATGFMQALAGAAKTKAAYKDANLNVFMFSWPSDGKNFPVQAYIDDRHDAMASGMAFARGLMKLIEFLSTGEACGQKVHLLCHSMGNYVLRNALQAMINHPEGWAGQGQLPRVFENIFSMAADEDADALEKDDKWGRLPELTKKLHIYFNNHDHALNISNLTKGNPDRMGNDGPAHPLDLHSKVTLVDVSRTEDFLKALTSVGHGYYDEQPKVVADVLQVLAGIEPDQVQGRILDTGRNRRIIV